MAPKTAATAAKTPAMFEAEWPAALSVEELVGAVDVELPEAELSEAELAEAELAEAALPEAALPDAEPLAAEPLAAEPLEVTVAMETTGEEDGAAVTMLDPESLEEDTDYASAVEWAVVEVEVEAAVSDAVAVLPLGPQPGR